jgi:hypothetical protein
MIKEIVCKITPEIYVDKHDGRDALSETISTEYISTLAVSFNS